MTAINWRFSQQQFFAEAKNQVEFAQDQRIFDFFSDCSDKHVYGHGDIDYFRKKIKFYEGEERYDCGIVVINHEMEIQSLVQTLKLIKEKLSHAKKIAIGINKFLLYSASENHEAQVNYESALKDIISRIFNEFNVAHHGDEHMKGNVFNFASPATQFFLTPL